MINWIIGIVIFSFSGWMLYKNIKKSKNQNKANAHRAHLDANALMVPYF